MLMKHTHTMTRKELLNKYDIAPSKGSTPDLLLEALREINKGLIDEEMSQQVLLNMYAYLVDLRAVIREEEAERV
jgi:hypothetical protein